MNPLVSIIIVTYNQEDYISQAIESVLCQKTEFDYQIIISDDCSKDKTSIICNNFKKNFPNKIILNRNEDNLGLVLNYKIAFQLCTTKYIALLEGDDYWSDEYKLQKQIDILESDSEVGLVHTNCDRLYEDGRIESNYKNRKKVKPENGNVFEKIIHTNFVTSITACFRKELFDKFIDYNFLISVGLTTIDYPLWIELAYRSKFIYLEDSTAVYRVLRNSISNTNEINKKEIYNNNGRKIKHYYVQKYKPKSLSHKQVDFIYDYTILLWAIKLKKTEKAKYYIYKLIRNKWIYLFLLPLIFIQVLFNKLKKKAVCI